MSRKVNSRWSRVDLRYSTSRTVEHTHYARNRRGVLVLKVDSPTEPVYCERMHETYPWRKGARVVRKSAPCKLDSETLMTGNTVPTQLIINDVLIARVSLSKPYVGKDAKIDPVTKAPIGTYHVDAIIEKTHPQLAEIKRLQRLAAEKKFKEQFEQMLLQFAATDRLALHNGDITRAGKPEYAGKLYLSCNNKEQPTIVVTENGVNIANRGTPVVLTPAHPSFPYPGCRANIQVDFYGYSNEGKGITCTLMGVQFFRHGPRLAGASVSSAGEFGLVAGAGGQADAAPPSGGDSLL